jgi:molybdopterin converting factor small subunit
LSFPKGICVCAARNPKQGPETRTRNKEHVIAIKVILPTAFVRHTDGQKQFASAAETLPALIADIEVTFPALGTQIKDESGKIRRFINIYVNDEDIRFLGGDAYAFQDGDEVMLIPSIAGGCSN